ncbi:TPA: hypothetical protein ACQVH3_005095 [Serratia marcescens]
MDISENRRQRLKEWFAGKTLPTKEKSYLSQLLTGKASFGERAARRIERDYGMPGGFLDAASHATDSLFINREQTQLTERQKELIYIFESLPDDEANRFIEEMREKKAYYDAIFKEMLAKRQK